jgi:hypothetical protein
MRKLLACVASFAMLALAMPVHMAFAAPFVPGTAINQVTVTSPTVVPKVEQGKTQLFTISVTGSSIPSSNPVKLFLSRGSLGSNVASVRFKANNDQSISLYFTGGASETKSAQVVVDVLGSAPIADDTYSFDVNAFLTTYMMKNECLDGSCTPQASASPEFFVASPSTGGTGGSTITGWGLSPAAQTVNAGSLAKYSIQHPDLPSQGCTYYSTALPPAAGVPINTGYCRPVINTSNISFPSGVAPQQSGIELAALNLVASKSGTYDLIVPIKVLKCVNTTSTPRPCSEELGFTVNASARLVATPDLNLSPAPSEVYAAHSVSYALTSDASDVASQADWKVQDPSIAQPSGSSKSTFRGVWTNGVTSSKSTAITATLNGMSRSSVLTVKPMYYFVSATPIGSSKSMLYTFRTLDGTKITKVTSSPDGNSKLNIVLRTDTNTLYDNSSPKNLLREYFITVTPKNGSVTGSFPLYVHFIPKQ